MNLKLGDTQLILEACKRYGLLRNQAAFILATAYHETAHTMKPVREYGGEKYLRSKKYYPYVGMGYTQVTWLRNYEKVKKETGVDVVADPNRLLDPDVAVVALIKGAMEGWWTGKKLPEYVHLKKSDYYNSRRVINGLDKAQLIAGYCKAYEEDLKAVGYDEEVVPPKPLPKPQVEKNLSTSKEIMAGIGSIITAIGGLVSSVTPVAQTIVITTVCVSTLAIGGFIIYNRLKARKDGER